MLTWEEITKEKKVDMSQKTREKNLGKQRAYEEYKAARPQARGGIYALSDPTLFELDVEEFTYAGLPCTRLDIMAVQSAVEWAEIHAEDNKSLYNENYLPAIVAIMFLTVALLFSTLFARTKKRTKEGVILKLEKQIAEKERQLSVLKEKERKQQEYDNLSPACKDIIKWRITQRNIIICILVLLSVALGFYSFSLNRQYAALDYKCEKFKTRVQELKDESKEIKAEYNFFHDSAVMVTKYGERYHSYGCKHLENSDGYYIYNIENAKYQGYTPCQDCNPPQ